ncbi:MAG: hypothetical protein PHP01_09815, partial [Phycisphaerae bacterium]|nr:hypothetical protein [Phycisphaerae bacterium]
MNATFSQIKDRIFEKYPDSEQIGESIVRFTRKYNDRQFAAYYVDVTNQLPSTQELLTSYQDRVIGGHYFKGDKSFQWNNYLFFVTALSAQMDATLSKAKIIIERDRNYARKFVISQNEIETVLKPTIVHPVPATAMPNDNVLTIWTRHLIEAGLDDAIFSDATIPTRLDKIESSEVKKQTTNVHPPKQATPKTHPY